jgi:hypothetical protein
MAELITRVWDRVSGNNTAIQAPDTTLIILFGSAHGATAQHE